MTAPLFYADEVPASGLMHLTGDDARHASSAMRLSAGEAVLISDGAGRVGTCTVIGADRRDVTLRVVEVAEHTPPREVRVVQAVPKAERGDLAVELLTETGASTIVAWTSQRTVADWRGKEQAKLQRWRRVAAAAAKQSRRVYLPQVADVVTGIPQIVGSGLVLHEEAAESLFEVDLPPGPITVFVGPEGGLTEAEVGALVKAGARTVRLGREILRTSTAGAAACVWIRGFDKRFPA